MAGKEAIVSGMETLSEATTPQQTAGRFGAYGGRYVPETLMAALEELVHAYGESLKDSACHARLDDLLHTYAGQTTAL